ncbi:MAG TPA: metabolite traffic protein EboE [Caulifigura sp.]|nr:metabolite traffic protein EboE [Caulifigura sp.]
MAADAGSVGDEALMSLSTLPLSYCSNVHPAQSLDDVLAGLAEFTSPTQRACGFPIAAGLWLARPVIDELVQPFENTLPVLTPRVTELAGALQSHDLTCYTLNTFPYGNFHSERVKDQVYVPNWTTPERRDYTIASARVLAEILPEGSDGSLSTVPLGFKKHVEAPDFEERCIAHLLSVAQRLDELHDETGRCVRLAIEPEPFCVLETTAETLEFFPKLFRAAEAAGLEAVARRHLGVCFDVCHQALEFEDVAASIAALKAKDIRINKLHITCALRLVDPGDREAREELAAFVEQRYLHQTLARTKQGVILRRVDLDRTLCDSPPASFALATEWRIHFHVPVHRDRIGRLATTQAELKQAIETVAKLDYAPHLEVETYTWGVLPTRGSAPLVEGLSAELKAVNGWLNDLRVSTGERGASAP